MGLKRNDHILAEFQGKECFIHNINISYDQYSSSLIMSIHLKTTGAEAILTMYNVSNIEMNFCSSIFSIEGFEIIDNISSGWSNEVRYCLNDFESGVLKLYFERYEITPCKNDIG